MDGIRLIPKKNGYSTKLIATFFDEQKPFFVDDFKLNSAKQRNDYINRLANAYEDTTGQPITQDDFDRLAFDIEQLAINRNVKDQAECNLELRFEGVDVADLAETIERPVDWLVQWVVAADQPTVFGARAKCGKTTLLCDLAVALASKTDWLGEFEIPKLKNVLFITGESSNRAAGKRVSRACESRELSISDLRGKLRIEATEFPQFGSIDDMIGMEKTIEKHKPDVLIIDPLYRGLSNLDSGQVADIGGHIIEFAKICRPASLIISHHTTKSASREFGKPPELEDLTGAGVHESCGNWWLMGRNVAYEWDHQHDLCVQFGGRDEQAGGKRILFDEKAWKFEISRLHDYRQEEADKKEQAKQDAENDKLRIARAKITHRLENEKRPQTKTQMRDTYGLKRTVFETAFADLVGDGTIVQAQYVDGCNRNRSGFVLKKNEPKEVSDGSG